jgi:transglutaminase superfamily protein
LKKVLSSFTSFSDVFLALRVLGWALVLPILKHVVPVRRLAAVMHLAPRSDARNLPREDRIVTFARWGARLIRWNSGGNCLERGLIAYRYLCQSGAKPTLVVGLGGSQRTAFVGHAWVLVDGEPVGESPASIGVYTPVFAFDHRGALIASPHSGASEDAAKALGDQLRPS